MIYEERCGRETGIELRETAIIKDGETCLIDLIARTAEGKKVRSNDLSDGRSGFVPAYAWCCLQIESFRFVRNELGTCYSSRSIVIEMMDKRKTKTKMSASICFRVAICRAFCRDCFRRFAHTYFSLFLPLPVSDIKNQHNSTILNIILHPRRILVNKRY